MTGVAPPVALPEARALLEPLADTEADPDRDPAHCSCLVAAETPNTMSCFTWVAWGAQGTWVVHTDRFSVISKKPATEIRTAK